MLKLELPNAESFDESTQEFIYMDGGILRLEHSLVSVSKWESKWNKIFLDTKGQKTYEETIDYVRCMCLDDDVDPDTLKLLKPKQIEEINRYISMPMTATKISNFGGKGMRSSNRVSSEVIYYMMIALNIPFECQYWHLNRLITLIDVCNIKNGKPQKMSRREILSQNAELNKQRRKAMHSSG